MIEGMTKTNFESYKLENKLLDENGCANTIIARFEGTPQCIKVEKNMKTKLCNDLIENDVVKENYVINHSYTNGLNGKNPNSRQTLDDYIETVDGIDIIGNYSKSNFNQTSIVNKNGIAPTVTENHGQVTAVVEQKYSEYSLKKIKGNIVQEDVVGTITASAMQSFNHDNCHLVVEKNRFFKQAFETLENNECEVGDTINAYNKTVDKSGTCPTLTTRPEGFKTAILPIVEDTPKLIGGVGEMKSNNGQQFYQQDRIYDGKGIAMRHPANLPSGSYMYAIEETNEVINPLKDKTQYGWHFEQQVYDENGIVRTVKAGEGSGNIPKVINGLRIRKLTPNECFKLMGVKPSDYNKITCSNAQKYKQAGNSIVTTCLMAIYSQLFNDVDYKYYIEELLKDLRTNGNNI